LVQRAPHHAQHVDVAAREDAEALLCQPVVDLVRQRAVRVALLHHPLARLARAAHVAHEDGVKLDAAALDVLHGAATRQRRGSSARVRVR
jgi:phage-related baseplate assembly protein